MSEERGISCPGAEVTGSYELSNMDARNLGSLACILNHRAISPAPGHRDLVKT